MLSSNAFKVQLLRFALVLCVLIPAWDSALFAQLKLTFPNGGERIYAGSTATITWTGAGISKVTLEYSVNSGTNWTTIATAVANTGSYLWNVPTTPSKQCLVRISDSEKIGIKDASDGVFAILMPQTWTWAFDAEKSGKGRDVGRSIALDASGNSYITGYFQGSASFGNSTLVSRGSTDIFVAKASTSGEWLWAVSAGGTSDDEGWGIAVDNGGNPVLTGHFSSTATFGTSSLQSAGNYDAFCAKLDTDGRWLWAVSAGGSGDDYGYGIAFDKSQNAYLAGSFTGEANFAAISVQSKGLNDMFVAKINPSGTWQWAQSAGGIAADDAQAIATDASGNSYVTGRFTDKANFGLTELTSGLQSADIFVAKINANGEWQWATKAGGTAQDYGRGITLGKSGNIYLCGYIGGSANFGDKTVASTGKFDAFVAKLNSVGQWQWVQNVGGISDDYGYGIALDKNENICITGSFSSTATFGTTTLQSVGLNDIFTAKLDNSGSWLWAKRSGGTTNDYALGIACDEQNTILITGAFGSNADFGNTLLKSGGNNVFVAKISASADWSWATKGGGTSVDRGLGIAVDAQGNSYVTGYFEGTVEFGTTSLTSAGATDLFVAKAGADGKWLWAIRGGGTSDDAGNGIALDRFGNVYVIGEFDIAANFGATSLISAGGRDAVVAKIDSSGAWQWAVQAGGSSGDEGYGIAVDGNGSSVITGYFGKTATFGATALTSTGQSDVFVAKLTTSGKWEWAVKGGSSGKDIGWAIALDAVGNSYITGEFSGKGTFGTTSLLANGESDIFLGKISTRGEWKWATQAGGNLGATGIAADAKGNIYVTGFFENSTRFGATMLTSTGNYDAYVAKADTNGTWLWATQAGGNSYTVARGISADTNGNTFVTGYFGGVANFGKTALTSDGKRDVFTAKLSEKGVWTWAVKAGGSGYDEGSSLAITPNGTSFITGYFEGTARFGASTLTSNGHNVFVARIENPLPEIMVIFPNGGEKFTPEQTTTITWSASPVITKITLEFSNDGGKTWIIIATSIPNSGAYSWTLPCALSTECLVRVSDTENIGIKDVSDAPFTIEMPWTWAIGGGGSGNDGARAIALDQDENAYTAGGYMGTITVGTTTLVSNGNADILITKSTRKGQWVWAVSAGGSGVDQSYGIAVDNNGNSFVTGVFQGSITFGNTTLTSSGGYDVFVAKISNSGKWEWATQGGGANDDGGNSIGIDKNGNSYVTGYFQGTANFGTKKVVGDGNLDVFVAKISASGQWQWAIKGGGTDDDIAYGITADEEGNSYITGRFGSTAIFGGMSLVSAGRSDMFVAKADKDGVWQWAVRGGGSADESGSGITVKGNGNVFVTGSFSGTAIFGSSTLNSTGNVDVFATSINSNGVWQWAVQGGGTGNDAGMSISSGNSGSSFVTGFFEGNTRFGNTTLTSRGGRDVFVAKLDPSGTWECVAQGGGGGNDNAYGICHANSGNIYVTGTVSDVANFQQHSVRSNGGEDVFIAKIKNEELSYLTLKSPNGGEKFSPEQTTTITWSASPVITKITLEFSNDGGKTWITIATGIPNSGAYSWTLPCALSTECLVRVSDTENIGIKDVSDAPFTIEMTWTWAIQGIGNISSDSRNILINEKGDSYIVGGFLGTIRIGNTVLNSNGSTDIFVAKANKDGVWQWAISVGGGSTDQGYGIALDSHENCYISGVFQGTVNFGTTSLTSAGEYDAFVAKLNTNGVWQWAVRGGSSKNDGSYNMKIDINNNIYILGHFQETVNFGTMTLSSRGGLDMFIGKITDSGVWQWIAQGGGKDDDIAYGITADEEGNSYVTGRFNATAIFGGTSLVSAGGSDVFVAKADKDGVWQWAVRGGGSGNEAGNGIASDPNGNVFVTGSFDGTASFGNTTLTSRGGSDIFAGKLNNNGAWQWAVQAGGNGSESGSGIATDKSGNSFITGFFEGSANFGNTTLTSRGKTDIFVAKLDPSGAWECVAQAGGVGSDIAYDITLDKAGNKYVTGYFQKTANFGNSAVVSIASEDIFIAKLGNNELSAIKILSPESGEILVAGRTKAITWSASSGISTVNLDYSTDGGTTWTAIDRSVPNSGSYVWNVPYSPSSQSLLRISDTKNIGIKAESDAPFSIATTVGVSSESIGATFFAQLFPNPTHDVSTLVFENSQKGNVQISIFEPSGRQLCILSTNEYPAGRISVPIVLSDFASGLYIVQIETPGGNFSLPMTILK